ncbi:Hypothetical protein NTJ_14582 [Nesidiocoris tenuis]|nr:Hypothetical protein NTJ_14582 [Nesidiocoris tenuis]
MSTITSIVHYNNKNRSDNNTKCLSGCLEATKGGRRFKALPPYTSPYQHRAAYAGGTISAPPGGRPNNQQVQSWPQAIRATSARITSQSPAVRIIILSRFVMEDKAWN